MLRHYDDEESLVLAILDEYPNATAEQISYDTGISYDEIVKIIENSNYDDED